MEANADISSILSQVDNRLKLAIILTPFMHFYLPFIGEIVVLCFQLSIIWLIFNIKNDESYTSFKPIYIFTAIYIASMSISNIILVYRLGWSTETLVSFFRYFVMVSHMIFILSLAKYFTLNDKLPFYYLPHAILMAAIILFVDINFKLTNIDYNEGLRIITSSNIRHLGHIVIVSTLYLSLKVLMEKKMSNTLFLVCTITSISLLIWLGGRGAILSYLIGLTVSLFIIYKHHKLKIRRLLRLAFLIIVSIIVSTPLNIYSWNGLNRLLDTSKYYDQDFNKISSRRGELWNESWELIKQKPIFGYGSESFLLNSASEFRHPHNFILQWLTEFGFVGTSLFTILTVFIIITGYYNTKIKPNISNLFSISCILCLLSNALVSGTLYYSPPFLIFCIISAYIVSNNVKIKTIKSE